MDMGDLFRGIAVVIDDQIADSTANVSNLIRQIQDRNIPCFTLTELPDVDSLRHLGHASFLILDWNLQGFQDFESLDGVKLPTALSEINIQQNIDFLKSLSTDFFSPIFIFTNEDKETVLRTLKEHDLYQDDKPNIILVKNKNELTSGDSLFSEIDDWVKKTPSIYVLKKWEQEYQSAKNRLFMDFYHRSPVWPKVLWETYEKDKVDQSRGLVDVIMQNLYTRMAPLEFEGTYLDSQVTTDGRTELIKVLEGERFIKDDQLRSTEIFTGDLFKNTAGSSWAYLLNIRAQCDLRDNPELYCLKGRVVDEASINSEGGISFQHGEFREKKNQAIVSFLDNGKIIEFSFRDLKIVKWNDIKNARIGRLLPPYITRIQQLYGLYFQRVGLPRTPDEVWLKVAESADAMDSVAASLDT